MPTTPHTRPNVQIGSPMPSSKVNVPTYIEVMKPSRKAGQRAYRNSLRLSGKLSQTQIKRIRAERVKLALEASK